MSKFQVAVDESALDANFKEHSTRGIGRYARELKVNFANCTSEQVELNYFNHEQIVDNSWIAKFAKLSPIGQQTITQQLAYPLNLTRGQFRKYDLLHFLAQMDGPSWCKKPYVLSVMDLIPIVCADLYQAKLKDWRFKLARRLEHLSIENASLIITISECSKRDLVEHLNIDPDKIFVTPLAVNLNTKSDLNFNQVAEKFSFSANQEYFLYVGGIDPRKNTAGLLAAFQSFKSIAKDRNLTKIPKLLIVGQISQDKHYLDFIDKVKALNLTDDVIELGFVTDEELVVLYQNTLALCFLSLYEGFGLTPLEAMTVGAPVISSNLSAMPEVLGDAALYVELDPDAVAKQMHRVFTEPELREELIEKGLKQAKHFSWQKTADLTMQVYEHYFQKQ